MNLNLLATVGWGLAGGLILEFASIARHRYTDFEKWPQYARQKAYWWMGAGWIACGGLLALLYAVSGIELSPVLSFHIGASAPLIVHNFTRAAPAGPPGSVDTGALAEPGHPPVSDPATSSITTTESNSIPTGPTGP